jgi:hypothetical protein
MENEVKLHEIVFGKKWFERNQKALLFLLNTPPVSNIMRKVLDIKENDDIVFIDPYEVCFSLGQNKFKREFHIARKYGYRLYSRFKYVWQLFHWYDMNFANRLSPKILNLGFDTLTAYPDAHTETSTFDGNVPYYASTGDTWANMIAAATGDASRMNDSSPSYNMYYAICHTPSPKWRQLYRGIATFDTSAIGGTSTVDSATFSFWGSYKSDSSVPWAMAVHMCSVTTASNTAISADDYGNFESTSFGNIAYASVSITGYNDISLNASGLANINKTGISKFGSKCANDINATAPTFSAYEESIIQAASAEDTTANNGKDPKLVVVYTVGAPEFLQKHSMII